MLAQPQRNVGEKLLDIAALAVQNQGSIDKYKLAKVKDAIAVLNAQHLKVNGPACCHCPAWTSAGQWSCSDGDVSLPCHNGKTVLVILLLQVSLLVLPGLGVLAELGHDDGAGRGGAAACCALVGQAAFRQGHPCPSQRGQRRGGGAAGGIRRPGAHTTLSLTPQLLQISCPDCPGNGVQAVSRCQERCSMHPVELGLKCTRHAGAPHQLL